MSSKSFITSGAILEDRLDTKFYLPQYLELIEKIEESKFSKANLHELCREPIHRGKTPEYSKKGTIPVIKIANLKNSWIDKDITQFVSEKFYKKNKKCQTEKGDILIASTGVGSLGKVDVLGDDRKYIVDGHITIIRTKKEEINPYFLLMYLRSKLGQIQIERYIRGATGQIELYPQEIDKIRVILPDRDVQNRIANQVRRAIELKDRVHKLEKNLDDFVIEKLGIDKEIINNLKDKRYFICEIEDRLDVDYNQPKYKELLEYLRQISDLKTLKELSEKITSGATPRAGGEAYTTDNSGIPFIRIVDIENGHISLENVLRIKREVHEKTLKRSKLSPNNLLLSMAGTIGIAVVVPNSLKEANINQALAKIILKKRIDPYYVMGFLNSRLGKLQSLRLSRPIVQANINLTEIKKIKVSIPSEEIQNEIGKRVRNIRELNLEFKNLLKEAEKEVEELI